MGATKGRDAAGTRTAGRSISGRAVAIALVFALSGVAGLAYEIVWVRQITLLIGSTAWAISLTVSGFLLGLTLGALLGGRLADRSRRWLLLYALMEVGVGLFGVALTELLAAFSGSSGLTGSIAAAPATVRVLLAAVLLLPPTMAMGATLPILTRWVARSLPDLGRHFTSLYALNTLGAAGGCMLTGFFAIPTFGLTGTAWVAAAVNAVAALSAFILFGLEPKTGSAPATEVETESEEEASASTEASSGSPALGARGRRALMGIFGLTGFLAIAYEVLWIRSLGLFVRSSVYAFTVLLSVFLLGLVIGAAIYAVVLQPKKRDLSILSAAQLLQAFAGLFTLAVLVHGRGIDFALARATGSHLAALWIQAVMVLLIPAIIIGVGFPLVVQATATHIERVGRQVGWLYSINTLGGIFGSLSVGFVLVPAIGTQWTFVLLALIGAALSVGIARLDPTLTPRSRRTSLAAACLVLPAAFLVPPGTFIKAYADLGVGEILDVVEGRDGTLAVLEFSAEAACEARACPDHCREHPYRLRQIRYASMSYASTVLHARRYMSSLAHLAMLTGKSNARVLIVAFGTGITAGTTLQHPGLESLTIVDVNEDVITASRFFEEANGRVLHDERVKVVIDDGRHFLAAAGPEEQWDVISFEPPPPTAPGVVNLYTQEFYELARRHLAPGGRLTQWVPMQDQGDEINRMLARSLTDSFAHVSLWMPSRDEAVYLASDSPLELDLARFEAAFDDPRLGGALRDAGFADAYDLLGSFVLGTEAMHRWTDGVGPVRDDHPTVEYYLSYGGRPHDRTALLELAGSPLPYLRGETPVDRSRLEPSLELAHALLGVSQMIFARQYDRAADRLDELIAKHGESMWLHHFRFDYLDCMVARPGAPLPSGAEAARTRASE